MTTHKFLTGTLFIAACACSGTSTLGNGKESAGGLEGTLHDACVELLACGPTSNGPYSQTECEANLRGGRDQAIAAGCGDLWDGVMACAMENPGSCGYEGYVTSPACDAHEDARRECMADSLDSCSGGGGVASPSNEVSCFIACDDFSAECRGPAGGPADCFCRTGPAAGATFQIDNCQSNQMDTVSREQCR
jgi:hypothetical protein